jgi:hypothetical protein
MKNVLVTETDPGTALCVAYVLHGGGVDVGDVAKDAGIVLFWFMAEGTAAVEVPSVGCVRDISDIGFSNLFIE